MGACGTSLSGRVYLVVKVGKSSRGAQRTEASVGVGKLAHFMHKITLFHQQQGGSNRSKGAEPPCSPLTLTTVYTTVVTRGDY